jgi:hypothetical protein
VSGALLDMTYRPGALSTEHTIQWKFNGAEIPGPLVDSVLLTHVNFGKEDKQRRWRVLSRLHQ